MKQVRKKHDFGIISSQEKRKFYLQELFSSHQYIKKYLILLGIIFIANLIPNLILIRKNPISTFTPAHLFILIGPFCLTFICFGLSICSRFNQNSPRFALIQFLLLLVGNCASLFCIIARIYVFFKKVTENSGVEVLLEGITLFTASSYFLKLSDLCNPLWYFKIINPAGYLIGWIVGVTQLNNSSVILVWVSCGLGLLGLFILEGLNASYRWKLFTARFDNESWNAIHKMILNKVRSPIAVLSIKGEITYANHEFKQVSKNDLALFCQKMRNLKRRKEFKSENEVLEEDENQNEPEREESKSSRNIDIKFEDLVSVYDTKLQTETRRFDLFIEGDQDREVDNLSALLEAAQNMLKENEIREDDYFVYDGKLHDEGLDHKVQSYEVAVSFSPEYQKIILILRNTTDHARIVKLESNNQYKDKLLASVSHELRTPLNGNLSLIEAAINYNETCTTVKEQFLIPAYRSGQLLLHLINDILDYSQIGVKKLRLNYEQLSIADTIKSCYQLIDLQAKRKGLELNLSIDEGISLFKTDHDRVRQIILNLLSNALKFTFTGSVTLSASMATASHLKITVKDTGIGIKQDDLKKLFREFTRLEGQEQETFNAKGVGLGLTIANKLAKRLCSGTYQSGIKVMSVYGKGSSFSFMISDRNKEMRLPTFQTREDFSIRDPTPESRFVNRRHSRRNSSLPDIKGTEETGSETINKCLVSSNYIFMSRLSTINNVPVLNKTGNSPMVMEKKRKYILVVDDEPFNILAIESFLYGYAVKSESAFNGKDAVDKVRKLSEKSKGGYHYDLILMDCQMPIMDGFEATRALRSMMESGEVKDVPIIGCTAFTGQEAVTVCYEVGMTQVIEKPLSKTKIEHIIKTFLEKEDV